MGGIGLNVVQGARIIGVDLNPGKRTLVEKFGMTDFINSKEAGDPVAAIIDLTDGGVDHSFECIGKRPGPPAVLANVADSRGSHCS